jgi:hypothetical protein
MIPRTINILNKKKFMFMEMFLIYINTSKLITKLILSRIFSILELLLFWNLSDSLLNFIFTFVVLGIAEIILPEDQTNDDVVDDEEVDTTVSEPVEPEMEDSGEETEDTEEEFESSEEDEEDVDLDEIIRELEGMDDDEEIDEELDSSDIGQSPNRLPSKEAMDSAEFDDIDLFEVNEAFAAVVLKFFKDTGVDPSKVNVNGGAMALGHPIGATGAMLIGTLVDELERQDKTTGLITMCTGGGMGTATIIERI